MTSVGSGVYVDKAYLTEAALNTSLPCAIAEIWMIGYLLMIGVKTEKIVKPDEHILAPATIQWSDEGNA